MATIIFAVLVARIYGYPTQGIELARFPLVVISCIFLEAIFAFFKIITVFPIATGHANLELFTFFTSLEMFFMLMAIWIFALKYYETATEVSIMLGNNEIS